MTFEELQLLITAMGEATSAAVWIISLYIIATNVFQPLVIATTVLVICSWLRRVWLEGIKSDRE